MRHRQAHAEVGTFKACLTKALQRLHRLGYVLAWAASCAFKPLPHSLLPFRSHVLRGSVCVMMCRSGCASPRRRPPPRVQNLCWEPAAKRGRACPGTRVCSLWPGCQVRGTQYRVLICLHSNRPLFMHCMCVCHCSGPVRSTPPLVCLQCTCNYRPRDRPSQRLRVCQHGRQATGKLQTAG